MITAMEMAGPGTYDADIPQLRELMETRGAEGVALIKDKYRDATGLCSKLKTSPNEGKFGGGVGVGVGGISIERASCNN